MSKHFKIVLFIRFFGYFIFLVGLVSFIFVLGPLAQAEIDYRFDLVRGVKRTVALDAAPMTARPTPGVSNSGEASFGNVPAPADVITPVSTQFGIVIEKINANAEVVPNVNPANEKEYVNALQKGVAHAAGTSLPGEKGNMYLFSHSTDAPWNIVRYNAIFYLLRELEIGDRVVIFYQGKRYDYYVFDKRVVGAADVQYLTAKYNVPVLTLQTCDPPGTLFKRLIVRAKLAGS